MWSVIRFIISSMFFVYTGYYFMQLRWSVGGDPQRGFDSFVAPTCHVFRSRWLATGKIYVVRCFVHSILISVFYSPSSGLVSRCVDGGVGHWKLGIGTCIVATDGFNVTTGRETHNVWCVSANINYMELDMNYIFFLLCPVSDSEKYQLVTINVLWRLSPRSRRLSWAHPILVRL